MNELHTVLFEAESRRVIALLNRRFFLFSCIIAFFVEMCGTMLKELDDPRLNNDVLRRKNPKKRVTKNDLIPREVNLLSAILSSSQDI